MEVIRPTLAITLFFLVCLFSFRVWQVESFRRSLKADQAELTHIKYGLFNVDEWKEIATDIITKKIDEFEVTEENREEVIKKTEELLRTLIDEVEQFMREENSGSLKGFFRQMASDFMVPFDEVRKGIPGYAEELVDRLNDPETKGQIKDFVHAKVEEFADNTVGEMDYRLRDALLDRYDCATTAEAVTLITEHQEIARKSMRNSIIGLAFSVLFLLVLVLTGQRSKVEAISLTLSALALLLGGLILPMIDIEATITQFSFLLAGERVVFEDQVLFFQSKSIFEVVMILVQNGDPPLVVVALLIFSFSILMPALKLILTMIAVIRGALPRNKVASFLIFRSAKWSMADVMVVALFMAYLGFSGVINSQLTQLERASGSLEVFTTNNSTLQLGFYLFTAYALVGILLSNGSGVEAMKAKA